MKKPFLAWPSSLAPQRLARTTLGVLLAGSGVHAVEYYKANNTTNLNQNASWVDLAGLPIATTPINSTSSSDIITWDNRVTAENIVLMGDNIGINTVRILEPGGPVTINGSSHTLTVTNNGGVNMGAATQDLTLGSGIFYRVASSNAAIAHNVPAGRTLTFNGPVTVRNNSGGVTVTHAGAGKTIYNGIFAPSNVVIGAGEVQFNNAAGNARLGTITTVVNGGRMVINNTSGSATGTGTVTINNTGIVTGEGSMSGAVALNSGATMIPKENGVGILKAGALALASGSVIKWEGIDAAQADLIEVLNSDGLTINGGTVELYNAGTAQPFTGVGTFNLFAHTGAIGGSGVGSLAVAESSKIAGQTYSFGIANGFVTLRIEVGSRPQSFWNVNANGNWSLAANWTSNGVPNGIEAIANLGGAEGTPITQARTVTLTTAATVGVLNIDNANSFTVAGTSNLNFDDGDSGATLHVKNGSHSIVAPVGVPANGLIATVDGPGNTLTVSGEINGDGGLGKSGEGTLVLTADNFYLGSTTVGGGVLQVGAGATTGSINSAIANSGTLRFNRSDTNSLLYTISGSGAVDFAGSGQTILTIANTYSGPTTISAGSIEVEDPLALQNSTLTYSSTGGTLTLPDFATSITLGGLTGDRSFPLTNAIGDPVALTVGQNNASTSYTASTLGTGSGFTKSGSGTFSLGGTHAFSGNATINAGVLSLDAGSDFTVAAVNLGAAGSKLLLNGGTLHSSAQSLVTNLSAGFDIVSGTATFSAGIVSDGNNSAGANFIRVSGGNLNTASLTMGRGALNLGAEPATGQTANGLYVNGGAVHITGALNLGTGANSSVSSRVDSGSLTVDGAATLAINNPTRWSVMDIAGGTFTSTDPAVGVRLGGPFVGQVIMHVRNAGTVAKAERVQFGQTDFGGSSILSLAGGELYVGAGGFVLGSAAQDLIARLRLSGGTLGATADSSSTVPVSLTGPAVVTGADALDVPHTVTFSGAVDGSGSLTKSGSGTVLFTSPAVSFTGGVTVSSGTLGIGGQTGAVSVAPGATLIPRATLIAQAASSITGKLGIRYDVGTGLLPGRIQAQGTLTLGAGSTLDINGTGTLTAPVYVIAGASGGVSGTFGTVAGIPSGYTLSYNFNDGSGSPVVALVGALSPYDSWAASFSLSGAQALADADPDGDGLKNLIEYGLGSNPTQSQASGVVLGRDGNFLTISFPHIAGGNPSFVIEANDDLSGEWDTIHTFPPFASTGTATYTDTVVIGSAPRRVLRLKVVTTN